MQDTTAGNIPRSEHPDPMRARVHYRSLNGWWDFCRDDEEFLVRTRNYLDGVPPHQAYRETILVPYPPQSTLSGIAMRGHHPVLWYRRQFELSERERSGHVLLTFGAVDFACDVWINGAHVGSHRGGYTPLRLNISHVVAERNEVELRVVDERRRDQPRGKQSWQEPFGALYRECSGIWQSVWLEFAPLQGIDELRSSAVVSHAPESTPRGTVTCAVRPLSTHPGTLTITILREGREVARAESALAYPLTTVEIKLDGVELWQPDHPALYDLVAETVSPSGTDRVESYLGFRTLAIQEGALLLNGRPITQRLVLDQGYWSDGTYTAPSDENFRHDIEHARALGFNGCRKHQKIEDPRFYYWADRLGFLVWEELPSAFEFTPHACDQLLQDAGEMVRRDAGHPSVVTWTLFNESWGIIDVGTSRDQQAFVRRLAALVRQLDPTRPIAATDGWDHVAGDIYGVHSYAQTSEALTADLDAAYRPPERGRYLSGEGHLPYHGKRVAASPGLPADRARVLTEYGGIGYAGEHQRPEGAWGYEGMARTTEELRDRLQALTAVARAHPAISGFVYTQLTDVEQEVNGLLYADRTPKIDPATIRRIIEG